MMNTKNYIYKNKYFKNTISKINNITINNYINKYKLYLKLIKYI